MNNSEFRARLLNGAYDTLFRELYGKASAATAQARYVKALDAFQGAFGGDREIAVISTPGRTEIGGNHTDHNGGYVLAAAVNLDMLSIVSRREAGCVCLHSQGFAPMELTLNELSPRPEEASSSIALVRGVIARMQELGYSIGGFDCYTTSIVPEGAGLSSSAAFEVQIGSICNHLYNGGRLPDILNAQIAQFAENKYFGKPCGLMDQTACAVGGLLQIDFQDFQSPVVESVPFDFAASGHILYIVNTGSSHADLTEDYAAMESEMKQAARLLGNPMLRQASRDSMFSQIAELRKQGNDRAILRAYHYFNENRRVLEEAAALRQGDFEGFKALVIESGHSSFMYGQNVYSNKLWQEQGISIALMIAEDCLMGKGAWRMQGGGFAGVIQAFVPQELAEEFEGRMAAVFGDGACHPTMVRPKGTICIEI